MHACVAYPHWAAAACFEKLLLNVAVVYVFCIYFLSIKVLLLICCYITSSPFVILIWLCVFLVSSWSFTLSSFSCFTVFPDVKCPSILYEDWTKCKLVVSYYRWVVTVQLLCYACFPVGCLRILTCCIVKNISCVSVPACGPTNFWVTSNFAPPPPPLQKECLI